MAKKYLKKCPLSLAIRKIKIKTTLRVYLTHVRMPKTNKTTDNMWEAIWGKQNHRSECKLVQSSWKTMWRTLKKLKIKSTWQMTRHSTSYFTDTCSAMVTAALLTIARKWK